MTRLYNDPASFTEDMLVGFLDANRHYAVGVPGGVVRAAVSRPGKVAVVVGGGSGHYPAFCGIVGPGFADGAVVGNVFTSPSAAQAASVARAVENGGGVLLTTGNYAGDVMNFGLAVERLRAEGVDARYLAITDDVASAPVSEVDKRRGIAGDFTVFKAASAAAEQGYDLDGVEQVARRANDRTRTLGVAFDGCTMPGADHPLFTVPAGQMGLGLGIHGEPGVAERPMPTAAELAGVLVDGVLAEAPQAGGRAAVILNGLGRTKYEELFIVWGSVAQRLRDAGVTVVEPEVGELVTSLDMAGCSLTMMWLDEELETLWRAPADTPAYRKGTVVPGASQGARRSSEQASVSAAPRRAAVAGGDDAATRRCAARVVASLEAIATAIAEAEDELGRLDAVAGDGDHGRGMVRGTSAAVEAARTGLEGELSAGQILVEAGDAWAAKAGGTSGVLWGAGLAALGAALGAGDPADESVVGGVRDAQEAVARLGGAEPGDKTMLDALQPFAEVLSDAVGDGQALASAWEAAAERAEQAARETAALRPRVGRARPLADRSVGTPDPGAVSLALCLRAVGVVLTQGGPRRPATRLPARRRGP
jgi:dihydroxyacetone kinase